MSLELRSTMQRHEDPWEWSIDQVARELVRMTNDHTVGEATRLNRINGECLLTTMTRENLKDEIGIIAFGTRVVIMRQVELWRENSRQYVEYMEGQDERRMRNRLKGLVEDHRLQREFKRVIVETDRVEERSSGRLALPAGRPNRRRSLSPLPDLGSMELVEEKEGDQSPVLRPHVLIREEEPSPLNFLDADEEEIGPLGGNEELMEVDKEPVSEAAESINILPAVEIVNSSTVVGNDLATPLPTDKITPQTEKSSNPAEKAPTLADKDRLSSAHDRDMPILSQSGLRRPSEHTRKKPAGGYLGPHALLVDDIFYGDRDLDAENSDDDEDTFYIPPSDVPAGTKKYVEKQIRHFLIDPEQTSIAKLGGLYRAALKPYRASLLRKHYKQSMTVFDVRGDKCKTYKALVDDLNDLEWTALDKPMRRNDSQRMTFGEDPESTAHPSFNYNKEDNSEHSYDYLLKWTKIGNDKALPEFGESGSEGEYDVQTWREIEEEEGEPLPRIPSKKPLKVKLDKGKRPARREWGQVRIEPEGSGEELEDSDADRGLGPLGKLPEGEGEREKTPVDYVDAMDLDGSPPGADTGAEAEGGFTLRNENMHRDVVANRAHRPRNEPDVIDLTQMDDGSADEAPRPPKRGRNKNGPDSEDRRRRPERERKRTKRYPEKEDPVFGFSDDNDGNGNDDEEGTRRRRRRVVEIVEDIAAKESRDNVHRLVKARARRIQLEEAKWKGRGGSAPDLQGKVQINVGKYANEDHIFIHPQIAEVLKPHQIKGIRFLWGELVQSGRGMGALLAHTMGLGKTFQVIALLHTIAAAGANPEPRVHKQIPEHMRKSRSLVICPAGLVDNWWDEFHNWLPMDKTTRRLDLTHIGNIYKIDASNSTSARIRTIRSWYERGGVLIMSYNMVRRFASEDDDPTLKTANVRQMLLEGPNIIAADEAHMMKNTKAAITKIAQQFKSTSRVALTGSPLSNNLIEYWTMIEWIDQKYLGPEKEFQINYVKPIYDGLWIDSTRGERRVSLKKLRVLKKILEPKVERADITAIQNFLPSKTEFLITIPLTDIQMQLYHILLQDIKDMDYKHFDAMHLLSLVNNHPYTVVMTLEKRNQKEVNPRDREEDVELGPSSVDAIMPTLPSAKAVMESVKNPKARTHSYRMSALRYILRFSIDAGDKVLVFTHSIPTLDLLEFYMNHWEIPYLRLDGTTDVTKRQQTTKNFNADGSADVFIISTKAGGLGLNLFGANRVVIFDFRWTPMWEQQAVGRAYRIGQKKPVFVYRLVAGGTYEDRLRNMVDFKQQLQVRVIDQKDPRRSSSKLGTLLLKPPEHPEQEDLEEFMGKDVVLDRLLKKVDFIRDISYTQTFIPDDEDDLDEQEKADADAELQQLQALREGAAVTTTNATTSATVSSSVVRQYGVGASTGGPVVSGAAMPDEGEDISFLRNQIQQSAAASSFGVPTVRPLQQPVRAAPSSSAPLAAITNPLSTPVFKRIATIVPSTAPARSKIPAVTPVVSRNVVPPSSMPAKLSSAGAGPATGPSRIPFEESDEEMSTSGDEAGRVRWADGGANVEGGDQDMGLKNSTMALRNQTEFATSSNGTPASERIESGATMSDENELAEPEPEIQAAPEISEDVGELEHGLLRLIGSPNEVVETLERPTPTPTPLPLVPTMGTATSSTTIASWKSPSLAPSIDHDLDIQDVLFHSLPPPRVRSPFRESPVPESPTAQGPSPPREPHPLRESPPIREPTPLAREPSSVQVPSLILEASIRESPVRESVTSSSPSSLSTSPSRPPSAHKIAQVPSRRPVVTWEEAARLQRITQAPPRAPQPPRRSTRVRLPPREEPVEGPGKKQSDKQLDKQSDKQPNKQSNKLERNRRKRANRKKHRQLKAANAASPAPLPKSVPQGVVGDQRQDDAMDVDLETEDQEQGPEQQQQQQQQDQGQGQGVGQGVGQEEDGEEEKKLTARERVMQWQLDNGKMPVGRYKAPAVKNRRNRS